LRHGEVVPHGIIAGNSDGWAMWPDDRLSKRMLFAHVEGTGPKGETTKPRTKHVTDVLESQGLSYSWYRKAQARADWRSAIKRLLQRT